MLSLCVRSPRGGVPSSAGPVWHHGGTGHADGGESVRRTEESCGFRSDDHALVKQTFLSWSQAFALTSSLLVSYHRIMQLSFVFINVFNLLDA